MNLKKSFKIFYYTWYIPFVIWRDNELKTISQIIVILSLIVISVYTTVGIFYLNIGISLTYCSVVCFFFCSFSINSDISVTILSWKNSFQGSLPQKIYW